MTSRLMALALTLPLLTVAACANGVTPTSPWLIPADTLLQGKAVPVAATATPAPAKTPSAPGGVVVTGTVVAPLAHVGRVIPVGGGNVVPVGGGNVVPVGGGNVVPLGGGNLQPVVARALTASRRVQALEEVPLANATVFLADAAGQPYPNLASTTTDDQGRYTFQNVPAGYTYMVVAAATDATRNKDVTLQTLVRATDLGATSAISTATSMVTLAVTEGQAELGTFNGAAFRTATEATARHLVATELPDLSDRSAILAKVDELAKTVTELKQALDAVRQDLQDIKDTLAQIKDRVNASPSPTPTPTPPGGMQPPPGGTQPPCPPVARTFLLDREFPAHPRPWRIEFRDPRNNNVIAWFVMSARGVSPAVGVPECPVAIFVLDANGRQIRGPIPWQIRTDAPYQVRLPIDN